MRCVRVRELRAGMHARMHAVIGSAVCPCVGVCWVERGGGGCLGVIARKIERSSNEFSVSIFSLRILYIGG